MDNQTIFTKTAKGLGEAVGKTKALSRDFRNILKEIDGKASVEELQSKLGNMAEAKLQDALTTLANGDYIREFASPAVVVDDDLDFTLGAAPGDALTALTMGAFLRELSAPSGSGNTPNTTEKKARADEILGKEKAEQQARKEAEEQARKKAMEQARREAEEKARRVAEAQAKKEAEEQARKKAAEQARREAEEKARREAEVQAKKEAEEQARKKAAEQAQREAEEKARREAEVQAKKEAEEQARKKAAEQVRREAEEKTRRDAEQQAKKDAAEKARLDAEVQAKQETEEKARRKAVVAQIRRDAIEKYKRDTEERARKEAEERTRLEAEALAKQEAEEQARRDAEEKARRDAEEQVRRKVEEKSRLEAEALARQEAEEQARRDAEEKTRRDAEERAQKEAEERARLKAEERIRQEAEHRARWEAEEEARLEAEARAQRQAEQQASKQAERQAKEKSRLEAEARAKKEAEERARRTAEEKEQRARREAEKQAEKQAERDAKEKTRLAAEAQAKQESDARAKQEEEETISPETKGRAEEQTKEWTEQQAEEQAAQQAAIQAKEQAEREAEQEAELEALRAIEKAAAYRKAEKHYRKPVSWGKYGALLLFFVAVVGLVLTQVMSFDDQVRLFEKAAAEQFQQPVKISKVHLALMPQPHWRFEGVSIGKNAQIKVSQIDATAELDTLFSDKVVFKSAELISPILSEEGLGWLLFGKSQGRDLKFREVSASNAKIDSQNIGLPAFDVRADIGADGMWTKITIDAADKKTHIELQPKGEAVQIEMRADAFAALFGSTFPLEKINAKGTASRNELALTEFNGIVYDGVISGNGKLKWGASWSLSGELTARQIDTAKLAPQLLEGGKLEASATYVLQGQAANKLFSAPRLKGNATIRNGVLLGVDLASLLRSLNSGGKSSFAELDSGFVYESGRLQLRNVHLGAGLVSASGSADVDATDNLSGRFTVDLNAPSRQARANLALSGTLREPRFNR